MRPFHGGNAGSNPAGDASENNALAGYGGNQCPGCVPLQAARWILPRHFGDEATDAILSNGSPRCSGDIYEKERRLLYVACTRAREHLLLTGVSPTSEYFADFSGLVAAGGAADR